LYNSSRRTLQGKFQWALLDFLRLLSLVKKHCCRILFRFQPLGRHFESHPFHKPDSHELKIISLDHLLAITLLSRSCQDSVEELLRLIPDQT
jgi:hypothetical protein